MDAISVEGDVLVSPSIHELSVTPNSQKEFITNIKNTSDRSISLRVFPVTVERTEESYQINESLSVNQPSSWLILEDLQINVEPGESIPYKANILVSETINEPKSFPALAFELSNSNNNNQNTIGISTRVLSYILPNIETEYNSVQDFVTINTFNAQNSFVFRNLENIFEFKAQNVSQKYIRPVGSVIIYSPSGKRLPSVNRVNEDYSLLFPEEIIDERIIWISKTNGVPEVGRYTAEIVIQINENQEMVTSSTTFIYIPFYLIAGAILLFSTIIFIALRIKKSQRGSK